MKLVHSLRVTPGRCGLYETAMDLIRAVRNRDVGVAVVDPTIAREGHENYEPYDAIIDHSGLTKGMSESGKPIIHMRHGRPHSSFLMEHRGSQKVFSCIMDNARRYAGVVTFWPEHVKTLEFLMNRKVHCIPAPVDLARWTPHGPDGYGFHGKKGDHNIVIADVWREDVDLFQLLCDFGAAGSPLGTRLHIYGLEHARKGHVSRLLQRLGPRLGEVKGWVSGLENVYRAADALLTPHTIATRAVREAMACGCPVVRSWGEYQQIGQSTAARMAARDEACERFSPGKTADAFIRVVKGVLGGNDRYDIAAVSELTGGHGDTENGDGTEAQGVCQTATS